MNDITTDITIALRTVQVALEYYIIIYNIIMLYDELVDIA